MARGRLTLFTYTTVTLFPALLEAFAAVGLARKARTLGLLELRTVNPRDFAPDSRRTVDDVPYGGGPGMVMRVEPLRAAISAARAVAPAAHVVYLSPQGRTLRQSDLPALLKRTNLVLVAGRYEGVDERLLERDVDEEISIGDYVLSGGEVPAMVLMDALIRLIPRVIGAPESAQRESFEGFLLDFPHYTRPEVIGDQAVPTVLLSGNHAAIADWRLRESVRRTRARRPDLLAKAAQCREDVRALLAAGVIDDGGGDTSEA